jgi:hypothetical protein
MLCFNNQLHVFSNNEPNTTCLQQNGLSKKHNKQCLPAAHHLMNNQQIQGPSAKMQAVVVTSIPSHRGCPTIMTTHTRCLLHTMLAVAIASNKT